MTKAFLASPGSSNSYRDHDASKAEIVSDQQLWTRPRTLISRSFLADEVDPNHARSTVLLSALSFMTGLIDAVSFTAIFVWCGFQTGNFVQLALALARLFGGPLHLADLRFYRADQQALTSLVAFNLGTSIGRFGDSIGAMTRLWLVFGTFLQAIFTAIAAIAIWKSGQPSIADSRGTPAWSNLLSFVCVAFISASLGLQGIMGKRLNTAFGTTLVLTTIWCELVAEPLLFMRRWVRARDHRALGAICIFVGGFVGRALVDVMGAAGALGIGTGIRVAIAIGWLFVPRKRNAQKPEA